MGPQVLALLWLNLQSSHELNEAIECLKPRCAHFEGYVNVHWVVSGITRGHRQRVGAAVGIALTSLVGLHSFVIPDLCSIVEVAIGGRRNMRNEVCIMDNSFMVDLRTKPASKLTVAHSWLSEGQQASQSSKVVLNVRQGKHSQSSA